MTFIHIDENQDVLASLEYCSLSLTQVHHSDRVWKWVVLTLHNALQGAMVCHLSGTAQLGALTKKSAENWLDWHDKDRRGEITYVQEDMDELGFPKQRILNEEDNPPPQRVATTTILFERLYSLDKRIEGGCGGVISVTTQQRKSFERLHNLRNKFTHFSPKGWSIELQYIKEIIFDVAEILTLILDDDWPFRHMSFEDKHLLNSKIDEIRLLVSKI